MVEGSPPPIQNHFNGNAAPCSLDKARPHTVPHTVMSDDRPYETGSYQIKLEKIREEIKALKTGGKLEGDALNNILAKHDALLQQWHRAAKDGKVIQNMDPALRVLLSQIRRYKTGKNDSNNILQDYDNNKKMEI